jgi:hypothetical protein
LARHRGEIFLSDEEAKRKYIYSVRSGLTGKFVVLRLPQDFYAQRLNIYIITPENDCGSFHL